MLYLNVRIENMPRLDISYVLKKTIPEAYGISVGAIHPFYEHNRNIFLLKRRNGKTLLLKM